MSPSKNNEKKFTELNQEIIELSKERPENFLEVGRKLKLMRDGEIYEDGGHEDFNKYLRSLVDTAAQADYSTANDLISIYEIFSDIASHQKQREVLQEIGWSKSAILVRYARHYIRGILMYSMTHENFTITKPMVLNITRIIKKGLKKSKKELEKDLKSVKEEMFAPDIIEFIIPDYATITKLWDTDGFRLFCPICEEATVRCFHILISYDRMKDNSQLYKVSHQAYFNEEGKHIIEEEVFSYVESAESISVDSGNRNGIQCFERGRTGKIVHDYVFKCLKCKSRQYMIQTSTSQVKLKQRGGN